MKIWFCKIGEVGSVSKGADAPMRQAVIAAYKELTGADPSFLFSGWGAELTESERAVVEDREPLASGRTACAHVLSEEECRAEFEALHADMVFVGDGMREFAYRWWKASRRAAGLVAEKKEGET